jgi:hypothetical protein
MEKHGLELKVMEISESFKNEKFNLERGMEKTLVVHG